MSVDFENRVEHEPVMSIEQVVQKCLADAGLVLRHGFHVRHDKDLKSPMAFNHKRKTILINPEFLKDKFTAEDIRYIFAHEISHFVQMLQAPELYEGLFTDATTRANKHPLAVRDQVTKIWHRFYNVFLDMSANALVDANNLWTQESDPMKHPRRKLYAREDMFPSDMTTAPRTEQFLFSLLRRVMLGPGTVTHVDEVVSQKLNKKIVYLGKEYPDAFAFAEAKFFNANIPFEIQVGHMQRFFAPMFEELIELDVSADKDDEKHISQANRSVDLDGEDLSPEHVKKILEINKEEKKPLEEVIEEANKARFQKDMLVSGFKPSEITTAEEIRASVDDIYPTLMDLWEVFTRLAIVQHQTEIVRQRHGQSVDVRELLRQLPSLIADPSQLKVFTRRSIEDEPVVRPQTIELYFAIDLSSSMTAENRRAVQECVYVIVKSLVHFSRQQEFLTHADQSPVKFKLRLLGFGSETEDLFEVTPADREAGFTQDTNDLDARLWRAILSIGTKDLRGTCDAPALQMIYDDVSRRTDDLEQAGQTASVVFEITDGASQTPIESGRLVQAISELSRRGGDVHARAIQIGGQAVSADEHPEDVFQSIWGDKGAKLPDVMQLREVLLRLLFGALRTNKVD
jgi:hypothetical protein